MEEQLIAVTLVGAVVGLIFVLDGWKRAPDPYQFFLQKPRVLGLLSVLGGGLVSKFLILDTREAIVRYSLATVLAIALFLAILAIYAFVFAFNELPARAKRWPSALKYTTVALSEGLDTFHANLDADVQKKSSVIRYLDRINDFTLGYFDALIASCRLRSPSGAEGFRNFVEDYLELFLIRFLEEVGQDKLSEYRACLYYHPKDSDELLFFAGAQPAARPFTKQTLPFARSLAGYALMHPGQLHQRSGKVRPEDSHAPFHERAESSYKDVVASAVRMLSHAHDFEPFLVLSVDCLNEGLLDRPRYATDLLFGLSLMIADAQVEFEITADILNDYFGLSQAT